MSQSWSEQQTRFNSYVSELRSRFDSLQGQITQLTEQVQNAPDIDSAVADQAARDAEEFKNSLDQLDQAFDLTDAPADSGGSTDTPSGGTTDPGAGGTTEPGTSDPNAPGGDVVGGGDVTGGAETPQDPTAGAGGDVTAGGDVSTPDPGVGGTPLPGEPDQGGGEVAPPAGTPEAPAVDPNDPNAAQPSPAPESPGSDPTQPVPGSEGG